MDANRAFDFIEFPTDVPAREQLKGHDRLYSDRYHGFLTLKLTALTPVFISAGITALGSDVDESVPLIKVMGQDQEGHPILQGTSLKGCIRAVYETITNSSAGTNSVKVPKSHGPNKITGKRRRERHASEFSPAELVFGAMGFQGLISIADAVGDRPLEIGYLPPMFQPKVGKGRKFYRHQDPTVAVQPSFSQQQSEPDKLPSAIQQAPKNTIFTTTLRFSNLTLAQLGALLIALGQDSNNRFALKLGAGKGKGLGSVAVSLVKQAIATGDMLESSRYLDYQLADQHLPESIVSEAIGEAYESNLIHSGQLSRLQQILQHPGAS